MTGSAILATFRTPRGMTVIKSELVDRISVQVPHLYRHNSEKNTGALVSVERKAVPFFRSGREMKSRLNSHAHGSDIDLGRDTAR